MVKAARVHAARSQSVPGGTFWGCCPLDCGYPPPPSRGNLQRATTTLPTSDPARSDLCTRIPSSPPVSIPRGLSLTGRPPRSLPSQPSRPGWRYMGAPASPATPSHYLASQRASRRAACAARFSPAPSTLGVALFAVLDAADDGETLTSIGYVCMCEMEREGTLESRCRRVAGKQRTLGGPMAPGLMGSHPGGRSLEGDAQSCLQRCLRLSAAALRIADPRLACASVVKSCSHGHYST